MDLVPGEYTLTIDGVGDATGAYSFRLLNLAKATTITPGTAVTGQLDPANETDAYKFSVAAGQRFYFDRLSSSGDSYWRLLDPFGRTVTGPTSMNTDLGDLTLGLDGSYTLLIEGRVYTSGTANYSFNVTSLVDPAPVAMALDQVVSGRISQAGLKDAYTFTLGQSTRVLFDSLTYNGSLNWSLVGPAGTLVSARSLQYSDSWEISGNTSLLLDAGNYTLTIDGDADTVGNFAFRLLSFGAASAITPGTPVSGTLADAGTSGNAAHGVSGAPINYPLGQTNGSYIADGSSRYVSVDDSTSLKPTQLTLQAWVYRDPTIADWGAVLMKSSDSGWHDGYGLSNYQDGRIHFFVNDYDLGSVSADLAANTWTHVAGTYDGSTLKLYLNGALVASKDYAATIKNSSAPLRIGSGAGGNYPWKGQIDDAQVWSVARSAADIAASYQQRQNGDEAGLAAYWRLDETSGDLFADQTGNANNGIISNRPALETRLYRFNAVAGERFYFDSQSVTGDNFSLRVFDPVGNLVSGPQWGNSDLDVFTASLSGSYVLALEGRIYNNNPSNYRFNLQRVQDATSPLVLGSRIDGSIEHVGQRQAYTFTLGTDTLAVFDSLSSNNNFNWTLSGPNGTVVDARGFYYSDSGELGGSTALPLGAGAYTLTVDGSGDTTGAFAFRLLDLAAATSIAYGQALSATLDPGNQTQMFRFAASAGDSVLFDWVSRTGGNPYWRLLDPFGGLVFGPSYFNSDQGPLTLQLTGDYTLLLEGRTGETAPVSCAFSVALQGNTPIPALTGDALTLGARVDGTLSAAGEVDTFVFTVSAPTRLYFDALEPSNNYYFRWSLLGPRGTEVDNRQVYYSDADRLGSNPLINLLLPGTYQLRMRADSSQTGAYAFRLLDLSAGTSFALGAVASGTLNPNNETDVFHFDAQAGDRVFFDRQTLSPDYSGLVFWRLLDPSGQQVFGPTTFNDVDERTLAQTGRYPLLVEGAIESAFYSANYGYPASYDYSFALNKVVDGAATALVVGTPVSATLATAGQRDTYTFNLGTASRLYMDSLTDMSRGSRISWTLSGPDGFYTSRNLSSSDSADLGSTNPLLRAPAGDYTLVIDGVGDATGDYSFALRNVASDAVAIGMSTAINGTLAPARRTDIYKFDALAGDRYYFDVLSQGSYYYYTTYRLLDPQGNQVWGNYTWPSDQDVATFALTGTYTLLVEGRADSPDASNSYAFNIQKVQDSSASLTIGATTSGSIAHVGQRAAYTFSLTEAKKLLFDGLMPANANPDLYWTLTGPRGVEVSNRRFYGSESHELGGTSPLLDLIAGDYTLTFDVSGEGQGNFSFRLLDIAAATPFAPNTLVSGQLDPSSSTNVYSFQANVGTRYYIDRQQLSGAGGYGYTDWQTWRMFDSFGRQVLGPQNLDDIAIFTPTVSGTYTLIVEGRTWLPQYGPTVSYSFKLLEITDDNATIVPGQNYGLESQRVAGTLGNAVLFDGLHYAEVADADPIDLTGSMTLETWLRVDSFSGDWQNIFYKGNGDSNQRTYSLWLNPQGYLHLSTGDGGNQTINTAAGSIVAGQWYHVAAVLDRSNGVMKIYLNGVEAATGGLRNTPAIASANPLWIGRSPEGYTPFQGAIDDLRLWNTARTAQQIADNRSAPLTGGEAGLVMYLPANEASGEVLTDATGNGHNAQMRHLFAGSPGVVAGYLGFGQVDNYSFTLAQDTLLYFDSLTDNGNLLWSLTGPRGAVVSNKAFQVSDSADGTSIAMLPKGVYKLTVSGNVGSSGSYAFRLMDLAAASTLALNTQVNGTLSPSNATVAYKFDAVAGENVYFDRTDSGNTYWRLLDPWGRTYWGPNYMGSEMADVGTLAYSGSYTLLIEGRRDAGAGSTNYGFSVQRVLDKTAAIVPGVAYGMDPAWKAGPLGGAVVLNGLQTLTVASDPSLDLTGNLTVEAWIDPDHFSNTWSPIFYKGDLSGDSSRRTYSMWLNANGSVHFGAGNSNGVGNNYYTNTAAGVVVPGTWTHVAGTVDRATGQLRIYINGVLAASGTTPTSPSVSFDTPLMLGSSGYLSSDVSPLAGAMDEVRVWNVARSAADILAAKDQALNGNEAGLVAYLKANEGSGATLGDATARHNDATLQAQSSAIVRGSIDQPGQRSNYTFTLTDASTRLYFDAITSNSNLNWTLSGPRGVVVSGRGFTYGDSIDNTAFFDLLAGDYTLSVDAVNDVVAPFAFRLLNLAQASSIAPGALVSGVLAPADTTAAYSFDVATAGQRYYFDALGRANGDTYRRLHDPYGRTVFGPTQFDYASQDTEVVLPLAGKYTLLVEGRFNYSGDAGYSFKVQPVQDQTAALTLGAAVSASIANVGQRNSYTFSLASAKSLYFDSRTNNSGFNWTLSGPRGDVVSGRSFTASDSYELGGSPVLELVAGNYTLTVDGSADATGNYEFNLIDLSAASTLTLGATVSASLNPGSETDVYRFDASARDQIRCAMVSESRNSPAWRLVNPYAGLVFGPSDFANAVNVTLPYTGTYYLFIEGRYNEGTAVDYSFKVEDLNLPDSGAHSAQNFDVAGLPYGAATFSATAPAVIGGGPSGNFLRLLPGSVTGYNTVGITNASPGVIPASVTVDFDLRITRVSNQGDGIGFAWLNSDVFGNSGPAPQFGEEVNLAGSFGVGFDPVNNGEVSDNHVSLHFNGSKLAEFDLNTLMPSGFRLDSGLFHHAQIVIEAVAGGSKVSVWLTPNGGAAVAVVQNYFVSGLSPYDGRMAFGARNGGWRADNDLDNISVAVIPGSAEVLPALVLGDTVTGTLSASGEVDRFHFNLTQATRAYFDVLTNNTALNWSLSGPRGTLVSGRSFGNSDAANGTSIMELVAGDYVLSIQGSTGEYKFRVLDLSVATEITPGTPLLDQPLNPSNETDVYKFSASAGERYYFDRVSFNAGYYTDWRLLDPFGRTVWGPNHMYYDDVGPVTLAYDGVYTLLVEGRYHETSAGTYSINVLKVTDKSAAMQLGQTVDASLDVKGQRDTHTFTLTEAKRVYFDVLTNNTSLYWTLTGPLGAVVSGRNFGNTDAANGRSIMDLAPGDYSVTVYGAGETTGSYAFRLLDLAVGTQIIPGTPLVNQTLNPSTETDVYWFDVVAGQRFYFDRVAFSGGYYTDWQLLDPNGATVWGPNHMYYSDVDVTKLNLTGRYTLLVEGRYHEATPSTYTINVQPVSDDTAPLTLNTVVSGSIATQGQSDYYTFSLSETKLVYFDTQTVNVNGSDSYYLRWDLTGPRGAVVSDKPFRDSDSYDGTSILELPPGDYTLRVRPTNEILGGYSFRLLDLGTAQAITTGTPVNGVLNPANETQAWRFSAQAGDRFYFDRTTYSGGDTYWRLLDPWGRTVWGPTSIYYDVDVTPLAFTGTYTLLVEGRYYVSGVASYGFNVSPSPLSEKVVIALETLPGPDLVVENLAVAPVGAAIAAGGQVQVSWQVTNNGTQPATAPWQDRILVRNMDRAGELIANVLVNYDDLGAGASTPLQPGESRTRTAIIRLVGGARGSGNLRFQVDTDVTNAVTEPGLFELNNSANTTVASAYTPYPDLQVDTLSVSPANGWATGDTVTLRWRERNSGDAATGTAWSDNVLVRNLNSGGVVLNATQSYDPALEGALGVGASRERSYTFTWPGGVVGSGQFEFVITADSASQLFESNADDSAETNNSTRVVMTSTWGCRRRRRAGTIASSCATWTRTRNC